MELPRATCRRGDKGTLISQECWSAKVLHPPSRKCMERLVALPLVKYWIANGIHGARAGICAPEAAIVAWRRFICGRHVTFDLGKTTGDDREAPLQGIHPTRQFHAIAPRRSRLSSNRFLVVTC